MNYIIAIVFGIVASILFMLTTPKEYLFLIWFVYLITFFGTLLGQTLEDIKDGICKYFLHEYAQ